MGGDSREVRFPLVGFLTWCAGLLLPLALMAWQPPELGVTYPLVYFGTLYGIGGVACFFSSDWAQKKWGESL